MTTFITGYQYGDNLAYIGPYDFPGNQGVGGDVHLPPRTLLGAPPDVPEGQEAAFSAANEGWVLRAKVGAFMPPTPLIEGK